MTWNQNSGKVIIYLLKCFFNDKSPDKEQLDEINLVEICNTAKRHSIEAMIYVVLEKFGFFNNVIDDKEKTLAKNWKHEKERILYNMFLVDIEREQILNYLESNGIWYMPLKGVILKDYYPEPYMRQMTDNDILFDKSFREEVRDFMVSQGYEAVTFEKNNHDIYTKSPVYNFEMHAELFGERHKESWVDYYNKDIKHLLVKDDDNSYGYHFSNEDFYVYMITHANNHFIKAGTGLRTLIDIYLYIDNNELDWKYIENETKKLEIYDFEKDIRCLSLRIFGNSERQLSEEEIEMLEYIVYSGANGTKENLVKYKLNQLNGGKEEIKFSLRLKYTMKRIFPGMEFFEEYYPFVYKHKWLIPFTYIYRIFKGLLVRKKNPFKEFRTVWKK